MLARLGLLLLCLGAAACGKDSGIGVVTASPKIKRVS